MDLVIVNKQKHVHYILPIIIFFSTIILSYAKIQETALPFLLPLFIVSFYSGYLYLTCFLTAIIGISIINQDTFTIVVIITLLLTIYLLNFDLPKLTSFSWFSEIFWRISATSMDRFPPFYSIMLNSSINHLNLPFCTHKLPLCLGIFIFRWKIPHIV